jgi:hypothetical protein
VPTETHPVRDVTVPTETHPVSDVTVPTETHPVSDVTVPTETHPVLTQIPTTYNTVPTKTVLQQQTHSFPLQLHSQYRN